MATAKPTTVPAQAPATHTPKAVAKPVRKPAAKPDPKAPKPAAQTAQAEAQSPAAKPAVKPAKKAATPLATKSAESAAASKASKEKKIKMVRDSFTMPKPEFLVLEELKIRAAKMGVPVKKTELLRAGIKALAAMAGAQLVAAVRAVPSLKTGRPGKEK